MQDNNSYTSNEMGPAPDDHNKKSFFDQMADFANSFFPKRREHFMADSLGQNLKGIFELQVIDANTGNLIEQYVDKNLVVNGGRTAVMRLLGAGDANKQLTKLAVGTNGTAPAGADTAITGAFVKALGTVSYPTISSVKFDWTLGASEANGINIVEFGILCTDNTLFARKVRALIAKNSDIILNGSWTITF